MAAKIPHCLLYDGECGLCRAAAEWVRERDRHGRIRLLPYQDPERARLFPDLNPDTLEREIHLILPDGSIVVGAAAFAEMLKLLPRYRWAGWLLTLPVLRKLAGQVYHYIARHRYRFMQGN